MSSKSSGKIEMYDHFKFMLTMQSCYVNADKPLLNVLGKTQRVCGDRKKYEFICLSDNQIGGHLEARETVCMMQ